MLLELPAHEVSRETKDRLTVYLAQLVKWQKSLNLVAPDTISSAEIRHFEDSLQILSLLMEGRIIDIGSGAGFPGLVLASAGRNVELIESDMKKCQFLKNVSREANIPVIIHNSRVENVDIIPPEIITARALAPLKKLLQMTEKWWETKTDMQLVFLKGAKTEQEIKEARESFEFEIKMYQSKTDTNGRILSLTGMRRIP